MNKLLAIAVMMTLSAFCLFAEDKEEKDTEEEAPVNYEIIQKGTYSGIKDAMARIITTQKDWEDVWRKHVSVLVPPPPVPEIDFDSGIVAVITLGEKRTSGYQIVLQKVVSEGDDIEVTYKATEPPEHSFTLQVLSQPYLMLSIEKPAGTVKLTQE